jgi:hypothetical protein
MSPHDSTGCPPASTSSSGTWLARSAGKHNIVPDVCITNRTLYRYMEEIDWWNIWYRIKTIRYWYPTSIYGRYWTRDIRYRYRYRIKTFDIGWQGGVKTSISKVFSSISNNYLRYRRFFIRYRIRFFDIGYDIGYFYRVWYRVRRYRINNDIGYDIGYNLNK